MTSLPEPYPWPHTVRGIPGPIPSLAGVPWTYPCVWCGDYYPAEAVLAALAALLALRPEGAADAQ